MRVNYQQLAQDDPGGTLDEAFAIMSNKKVDVIIDVRLNDVALASRVGIGKAMQFQGALKAAVADGGMPGDVLDWFNGSGIELNNNESIGLLNSMADNGYISLQLRDEIIALRVVKKDMYPGLKIGHLQNAREKKNNAYGLRV